MFWDKFHNILTVGVITLCNVQHFNLVNKLFRKELKLGLQYMIQRLGVMSFRGPAINKGRGGVKEKGGI